MRSIGKDVVGFIFCCHRKVYFVCFATMVFVVCVVADYFMACYILFSQWSVSFYSCSSFQPLCSQFQLEADPAGAFLQPSAHYDHEQRRLATCACYGHLARHRLQLHATGENTQINKSLLQLATVGTKYLYMRSLIRKVRLSIWHASLNWAFVPKMFTLCMLHPYFAGRGQHC